MRKIVIVGGGPAGLAAARALHSIALEVVVVERNDYQDGGGAGIALWPNGTRALDQLGVLAAIRRRAAAISEMAMRTNRDRLLFGLKLFADTAIPGGYPSLALTRAHLIGCLRDGLDAEIVRGSAASRFSVEDGRVAVKLENSREIVADYLIGADGERSTVRRQLLGPAPGRHAGYVVWRGVAPIQPYGATGICWLGKGIQFGTFPLPLRHTYWFATALTASGSLTPTADQIAELGALFGDWPRPICEIIAATSPDRLVLTHPFVYPRLPSWAHGPVALVGDAAHPLEPTLGQGACLAFEDAVVLTQSLRAHTDVRQASAHYVAARLKRANRLVAQAHAFGRVGKWKSGLACGLRNLAIAGTPSALHRNQIATMFAWSPTD